MILPDKTFVKNIGRETSGQEIAEAALVLPMLFLLFLGIFWVARAYNIYATVTQAARAGAALAAHSTCASCGNATPLPGAVAGEVNEALQAAHLDPSQIQTYQPATTLCTSPPVTPACNVTGNNITVCQGVLLNPGGQTQQCGARVSFQYPDSLAFPLINLQSLNIPATADAPMEY